MFILSFLPIMIIFAGTYLSFKLDFFHVKHPIRTLKFAFSGQNTKKSVLSLLLALAGTLGVGNIVGVASGLYIGGPGSVFWLILSVFFSSVIKYSEVFLASSKRRSFGMIGVIEEGGKENKTVAKLYAALALLLSLSMGAALQGSAIRSATLSLGDKAREFILSFILLFK